MLHFLGCFCFCLKEIYINIIISMVFVLCFVGFSQFLLVCELPMILVSRRQSRQEANTWLI